MEKKDRAGKVESKSDGRRKLYVGAIVVLAILLAAKFYFDHQEKQKLEVFYQTELEAAEARFERISAELDEKIIEIDSLGGEIGDLEAARDSITLELEQLQRTRRANRALIQRLSAKTEGYEELLRAKDEEIEELKTLTEALMTENTGLKEEKNELNRSINELNTSKQQLESKVAEASRLKVENMAVFAIAKNGKEREGSFRRRQVEQLKVEFNIAENNVAPFEAKDIVIRVIDPNGQVIFDIAKGSGTMMIDGKEEFYTSSQTIVFDNSGQKLSFIYDKGSEYKSGQYSVEALTDGYRMGSSTFTVR